MDAVTSSTTQPNLVARWVVVAQAVARQSASRVAPNSVYAPMTAAPNRAPPPNPTHAHCSARKIRL